MRKKISIITTQSNDPFYNLAVEKYLFDTLESNRSILFFWQNEDSVIIGRNQNPFLECRMDYIERYNIRIARRETGGGAVFHDSGNLNFSFICNESDYYRDQVNSKILDAIKSFGIDAEIDGRNDIVVHEKKICGMAYLKKNGKELHHGCILVHTDLEKLSNCLSVGLDKLESKGISSVKKRVDNLNSINPLVSISALRDKIEKYFIDEDIYSDQQHFSIDSNDNCFEEYVIKYTSDMWIYSNCSDLKMHIKGRFDWGGILIAIDTDGKIINSVDLYSDSLEIDLFREIRRKLTGCAFRKEQIEYRIQAIDGNNKIINDICELFKDEIRLI